MDAYEGRPRIVERNGVTPASPNEWLELEPLVDQVLDAEPAARAALIDRLSGADTARRSALERLVAECERDHRLLDQPAAERFAGLFADEAVPLPPTLAERYHLTRLGRGGMAVVYLARDEKHARDVAVKVVRPELAVAIGKSRFLREIEIAAKLHHPHIVSLYDSGEADGVRLLRHAVRRGRVAPPQARPRRRAADGGGRPHPS